MAKATAKNVKLSLNQRRSSYFCYLQYIIISLTKQKVRLFHGLQLVKWVLEVLKKNTPYAAQMAAEDCSKVAIEAGLKKK
jgi:small subunit ribosomal protein S11